MLPDWRHNGYGYGALLLADAIKRIVLAAKVPGGVTGFLWTPRTGRHGGSTFALVSFRSTMIL
jgi:hypothetical protein